MADKIQNIEINPNTFVGSQYSQLAHVTVSDIDVTLEFVFVNPRSKTGQVISRITLPKNSGIDLATTIMTVVKVHEKKKKGEQNG